MNAISEKAPSQATYDVVIAGAGIMGLSIAWELVRRTDVKIAVLDKGAGTGEGSTGASSAICRCRYSMDEMLQLANDGVSAYRNWQAYTGLGDPQAEFQNDGVLWMPGSDTAWADVEHARLMHIAHREHDTLRTVTMLPGVVGCQEIKTIADSFELVHALKAVDGEVELIGDAAQVRQVLLAGCFALICGIERNATDRDAVRRRGDHDRKVGRIKGQDRATASAI